MANGEIITELPTSRQVVSEDFSPAFSQSSWARPVSVRSGSSTAPLPIGDLLRAEGAQVEQERSASLPKRSRR